jgi:hypothetical protein
MMTLTRHCVQGVSWTCGNAPGLPTYLSTEPGGEREREVMGTKADTHTHKFRRRESTRQTVQPR